MKDEHLRFFHFLPSLFFFALFFAAPHAGHTQSFSLSGVMQHSTLEGGGCWFLQSSEGKQYELFGDSATIATLHVSGAVVDLTVEPVRNGASICMIGEIVRVLQIQDVRRQPYDPPVTPATIDGTVHKTKAGTWYVKLTNGTRFEFQDQSPKTKRHTGAHFQGRVMLLTDRSKTKEQMDGLILIPHDPSKKTAPREKNKSN